MNPPLGVIDMSFEPGTHVIARTYSAGVFAGTIQSRSGTEAVLSDARRVWSWSGAASLSELATKGTSKPSSCLFPAPVSEVLLTEVIEMIPTTAAARKSFAEVPVWTEHVPPAVPVVDYGSGAGDGDGSGDARGEGYGCGDGDGSGTRRGTGRDNIEGE